MCETPSWRLELWPLPPTLHKHLYLYSDHRTKDVRWVWRSHYWVFSIFYLIKSAIKDFTKSSSWKFSPFYINFILCYCLLLLNLVAELIIIFFFLKKTTYNIITALVQHFFHYELTGRIRVIPKPDPINSGSR